MLITSRRSTATGDCLASSDSIADSIRMWMLSIPRSEAITRRACSSSRRSNASMTVVNELRHRRASS